MKNPAESNQKYAYVTDRHTNYSQGSQLVLSQTAEQVTFRLQRVTGRGVCEVIYRYELNPVRFTSHLQYTQSRSIYHLDRTEDINCAATDDEPAVQYSALLAVERTTSTAAQRPMTATDILHSVLRAVERTTSTAAQ